MKGARSPRAAAGGSQVAAALASESEVAVHRVDLERLQGRLREQGQNLSLEES